MAITRLGLGGGSRRARNAVIVVDPTAILSGDLLFTEADARTGGNVSTITLTNATWRTAGFDDQRQRILNGLVAAQNEPFGWNNVLIPAQPVTAVVRTSDTVVTITYVGVPAYDITVNEIIKATVPGPALEGSGTGSSWGLSWGFSWGNSWGPISLPNILASDQITAVADNIVLNPRKHSVRFSSTSRELAITARQSRSIVFKGSGRSMAMSATARSRTIVFRSTSRSMVISETVRPTPPLPDSFILKVDGGYLLLTNGGKIIKVGP